jgi:hypothetical protein
MTHQATFFLAKRLTFGSRALFLRQKRCRKVLISLFNAVCNITLDGKSKESDNMFERVMKSTSVTLNADVAAAIEERRLLWTNYDNLFAQVVCKSAFEEAFSIVNNQCSWAKVGAATPQGVTMACLNDPNVRHDGNAKKDPDYDKYQDIQHKNDYSTGQLNAMGYQGDLLRVSFTPEALKASKTSTITVATGQRFHVTGG